MGIFNDRELSSITNPRLQNLKEKSFGWDYKITYNPGKWHRGPDAMSRNPVSLVAFIRGHPTDSDFHLVDEQEECMRACTVAALNNLPKCLITIDDIISAGQLDDSYSKLKNAIEVEFPPSRNETDPVIRKRCNDDGPSYCYPYTTEKIDPREPSLSPPRCNQHEISCQPLRLLARHGQ